MKMIWAWKHRAHIASPMNMGGCTLDKLVIPSRPGLVNATVTSDCISQRSWPWQNSISLGQCVMINGTILAKKFRIRDRLVREATKIKVHPDNMKMEDGFSLADSGSLSSNQLKKGRNSFQNTNQFLQTSLDAFPLPSSRGPGQGRLFPFPDFPPLWGKLKRDCEEGHLLFLFFCLSVSLSNSTILTKNYIGTLERVMLFHYSVSTLWCKVNLPLIRAVHRPFFPLAQTEFLSLSPLTGLHDCLPCNLPT